MTTKPTPVLVFARRLGVHESQVRRAIDTGRLERSVRYVRGRPTIADARLARREWVANRDPRGR